MKILHIMNFVPRKRGAFELFLIRLAKASQAQGWESHFVFAGEPVAWFAAELKTVASYDVVPGNPVKAAFAATREIVSRLSPSVITFAFVPLLHPRCLLVAGTTTARVIMLDHCSWETPQWSGWRKRLAWLRGRVLGRFYWRTVSVSEYNRRRNIEGFFFPPRRNVVIHNGCLTPPRNTGKPADLPDAYIFFAGQLSRAKGVHTLIQAYARLAERRTGAPRVCLALAGDGPDRDELARLADALGFAGQVHFLGLRDDVPALMAHATVIVVPSEWPEAFGFVAVEAMQAGKPLIVSDAGALPEVVADTATVFPKGNAEALAERLADVLTHPEAFQDKARAALIRAAELFTIDRMVREYIELFRAASR